MTDMMEVSHAIVKRILMWYIPVDSNEPTSHSEFSFLSVLHQMGDEETPHQTNQGSLEHVATQHNVFRYKEVPPELFDIQLSYNHEEVTQIHVA